MRAHIKALLSVHPHSIAAYDQLGGCAINEGRKPDALAAFSRALELIDRRLDDLCLDAHRPDEIERRAAALRETVTALRAGRMPPVVIIE